MTLWRGSTAKWKLEFFQTVIVPPCFKSRAANGGISSPVPEPVMCSCTERFVTPMIYACATTTRKEQETCLKMKHSFYFLLELLTFNS